MQLAANFLYRLRRDSGGVLEIDAWMADLAKDVPRLRGVSAGSVLYDSENAPPEELRAVAGFQGGGQYRDRTCDPYHVKVVLYR
jgi:hypothetical protein